MTPSRAPSNKRLLTLTPSSFPTPTPIPTIQPSSTLTLFPTADSTYEAADASKEDMIWTPTLDPVHRPTRQPNKLTPQPSVAPSQPVQLVCVKFFLPPTFDQSRWNGTAASLAMRAAIASILRVNISRISYGYIESLCRSPTSSPTFNNDAPTAFEVKKTSSSALSLHESDEEKGDVGVKWEHDWDNESSKFYQVKSSGSKGEGGGEGGENVLGRPGDQYFSDRSVLRVTASFLLGFSLTAAVQGTCCN